MPAKRKKGGSSAQLVWRSAVVGGFERIARIERKGLAGLARAAHLSADTWGRALAVYITEQGEGSRLISAVFSRHFTNYLVSRSLLSGPHFPATSTALAPNRAASRETELARPHRKSLRPGPGSSPRPRRDRSSGSKKPPLVVATLVLLPSLGDMSHKQEHDEGGVECMKGCSPSLFPTSIIISLMRKAIYVAKALSSPLASYSVRSSHFCCIFSSYFLFQKELSQAVSATFGLSLQLTSPVSCLTMAISFFPLFFSCVVLPSPAGLRIPK